MTNNKKGLSQVVTTVLIILLVLVAVLIIWGFVRPTIESAGEQVGAECLTVDLEVVGCINQAFDFAIIKRHAGAGNLEGVKLIVDGAPCPTYALILDELGTDSFQNNCGLGNLENKDIEVAAVVSGGQLCQPSRPAFNGACS